MPVEHDAIGVCPAILTVDPFATDAAEFERVVRAAAAAGFTEFSLWPTWADVYGGERARELFDSLGITVPTVEAITQWAKGPGSALETEATAMIGAATAFGARMILACTLEPDLPALEPAIAGFRAVCAEAATHDLRVCIEFFPWSGMPDLATAWAVVEASGAANGGIVIDMMHWQHQNGGPNFDLLERIPGERIHYVQICDTAGERAPTGEYMQEALSNRCLPGAGDVDIARLLRTLDLIGADPWCAYEVFNHELAGAGPDAMAQTLQAVSLLDLDK